MHQYKRRLHNHSVDIRQHTTLNDRKHSLDAKNRASHTVKKTHSPSPQNGRLTGWRQVREEKHPVFKQSKEEKYEMCRRFQTEKVSLAGSQASFQRRKLSFGKSTDLKILVRGKTPSGEMQFQQAVELIGQGNYQQAAKILSRLAEEKSSLKVNSQLWLAICYRKTGRAIEALQLLNLMLKENPSHYEALICRCKIFMRLGKAEDALGDIETCITIDEDKGLAYIVKGDCLKLKHQYQQAIECYDKALEDAKANHFSIEAKKLQILMETKQYQTVTEEVERLLKGYGPQSEFLSVKGMAQKELGNLSLASLTFQQSLKYNNSKKGVSKSLFELVKIKMEERDFYAAYHSISRSEHLNVDPSLLSRFKHFCEAAVLLMKRKFEEGLKILEDIKGDSTDQFMNPLLTKFRAYALFCFGRHEEAIEYYEHLLDIDQGSQFNYLLCKGITLAEAGKYAEGIKFFTASKNIFPTKIQPYIYIASAFIKKGHSFDDFRKDELIMQALREANEGDSINDANSNLLYHRAIIYYYLKDWEAGLADINRCIEKAEDNLPKYFYLRGLGYACLKDLVSAINEFSIGISLSKRFSGCYLERAKCLFLLGDTEKAFLDLHTYVEMEPDDYYIHKWIGNLLYESRSYTDALKTFEEIGSIDDTIIMKAKCGVRLGLIEATKDLIKQLEKSSTKYEGLQVDECALNLLQLLTAKDSSPKMSMAVKHLNEALAKEYKGEIFKLLDCMVLIGSSAFYMGKYTEAYSSFDLAKQLFEGVTSDWKKPTIKSEVCEHLLDLDLFKLNFNLFLCLVGQNKISEAVNHLQNFVLQDSDASQISQLSKILISNKKYQRSVVNLIFSHKGQCGHQFSTIELPFNSMTIKTKLLYGVFHDDQINNLYPIQKSQSLIKLIRPTYIENKPEAPWIKRNPHGVIFTDDLLSGQSIQLDSTEHPDSERNLTFDIPSKQSSLHHELSNFRKEIQLDQQVENRLNRIISRN